MLLGVVGGRVSVLVGIGLVVNADPALLRGVKRTVIHRLTALMLRTARRRYTALSSSQVC